MKNKNTNNSVAPHVLDNGENWINFENKIFT